MVHAGNRIPASSTPAITFTFKLRWYLRYLTWLLFYIYMTFLNICVLGEMTESRQKKVRIKEIDGWTLGMLIDYVYTAEIQVTEENVQVSECG